MPHGDHAEDQGQHMFADRWAQGLEYHFSSFFFPCNFITIFLSHRKVPMRILIFFFLFNTNITLFLIPFSVQFLMHPGLSSAKSNSKRRAGTPSGCWWERQLWCTRLPTFLGLWLTLCYCVSADLVVAECFTRWGDLRDRKWFRKRKLKPCLEKLFAHCMTWLFSVETIWGVKQGIKDPSLPFGHSPFQVKTNTCRWMRNPCQFPCCKKQGQVSDSVINILLGPPAAAIQHVRSWHWSTCWPGRTGCLPPAWEAQIEFPAADVGLA